MNEELIRQCAREAALSDDGAYPIACGIASIRLYHARHVAPLVEAAMEALQFIHSMRCLNDEREDARRAVSGNLKNALAPFQQEGK